MKKQFVTLGGLGVAIVTCVALSSGGSATAAQQINGANIKNGTVTNDKLASQTITSGKIGTHQVGNSELKPEAVTGSKLGTDLAKRIDRGAPGAQTDGPYPGQTQVPAGNSTEVWPGDGGTAIHKAWVNCDDGKVAVGGGFAVQGGSDDNGSTEASKDIQITASVPSFKGDYKPINDQGSYVADRWLVLGFNNGTTQQTVRPYVICVNA